MTRFYSIARYFLFTLVVTLNSTSIFSNDDLSEKTREYYVKSLFLYNFANYVKWPKDAFEDKKSTLKMCLFGSVPFGNFLDYVDGTPIRDRQLQIIRSNLLADIKSGCHILFVGTDRLELIEKLFANINHLFVLSIGNIEGFTDKGGIINILRTSDSKRFEINLSKAIQSGLLINSDMLALARIINQ